MDKTTLVQKATADVPGPLQDSLKSSSRDIATQGGSTIKILGLGILFTIFSNIFFRKYETAQQMIFYRSCLSTQK